jgi:predicted flap endonuclease-1-like 5' DNA nuclease
MRGKFAAMAAAVAAAVSAVGAATWARRRKTKADAPPPAKAVAKPPAKAPPKPPAKAPPISPDPASDPPASSSAPAASSGAVHADDLTAIKGLGKVKAARLVEAGVTSYSQIAAWTDQDIAEFGLRTNTSPGQIKREDWVGQARELSAG